MRTRCVSLSDVAEARSAHVVHDDLVVSESIRHDIRGQDVFVNIAEIGVGVDALLASGREVDVIEAEQAEWLVQDAVPKELGIHAIEEDRLFGIPLVHACDTLNQVADPDGDVVVPLACHHHFRQHHRSIDRDTDHD